MHVGPTTSADILQPPLTSTTNPWLIKEWDPLLELIIISLENFLEGDLRISH